MADKKNKSAKSDNSQELMELIEQYLSDPKGYLPKVEGLVKDNPDSWLFHYMLAEMKSTESETLPEAIYEYSICIQLQPDQVDFYYNRAMCYEKLGDIENALDDLRTTQGQGVEKSYLAELLRLEVKAENYENAWQLFLKTHWPEIDDSAEPLWNLAQHYKSKRLFDQALKVFESIMFVEGGSRFDMWDPQDEIDAIKQEPLQSEIDRLRNVKFLHEKKLGDIFLQIYVKIHGSSSMQKLVNFAIIIYAKRIVDVNHESGDASPYAQIAMDGITRLESLINHGTKIEPDVERPSDTPKPDDETLVEICKRETTLHENALSIVVDELNRYIFSLSNVSMKVFGKAFHSFIAGIELARDEGMNFEHISGGKLRRVINDYLTICNGDRLFDPAMGFGGLLIPDQYVDGNETEILTKAIGLELSKNVAILGRLNLVLNGVTEIQVQNQDALIDMQNSYDCDVAVCDPPFGRKIKLHTKFADTGLSKVVNQEFGFLHLMLSRLKFEGKFAIVCPLNILSQQGKAADYRKYLLENDYLDLVIGLPDRTYPGSSMQTAIVFGTKRATPREVRNVEFIEEFNPEYELWEGMKILPPDNREPMRSTSISHSSLVKIGCNLDPKAFHYEATQETIEAYTGEKSELFSIRSVTLRTWRGKSTKPTNKSLLEKCAYIKVGDLKDNDLDHTLDLNSESSTDPDNNSKVSNEIEKQLIRENCVLVSLVGEKLMPTIFKFNGTPILINQNILALFPDTSKVSLEFLVRELKTERVLRQVQLIRTRGVISNLRAPSFLKIRLDIPELKEQERRLEDLREYIVNEKLASDAAFRLALDQARTDFNNGLGLIRHQLNNIIGTVGLNADSLIDYIQDKHPQLLGESIVPVVEGQEPKQADTVDGILNHMRSSFQKMSGEMRMIQLITKGLGQGAKIDLSDISHLFRKKISEHQSDDICIKANQIAPMVIGDQTFEMKPAVYYDEDLLGSALDQIILNAIRHGKRDDEKLNIWLSFNQFHITNGIIYNEISVRNDGDPLPADFSLSLFSELGGSTGLSKNSGIGGYVISKIVEMHEGILEAENLPNGQVEIAIFLPTGMTEDELTD
jgi:type I restriction enzyme M protein